MTTAANQPLMLDIDAASWATSVDRVGPWLATTATLQSAFGKMVEAALGSVSSATIQGYLTGIRDAAHEHERQVPDLYRAFGLQPPAVGGVLHAVASAVVGTARQAAGHVEGLVSGGHGAAWRTFRELQLTNLDATSGFAVAQQLALALGLPRPVHIILPILKQKAEYQLQLKECFLEMAPLAILYQQDL